MTEYWKGGKAKKAPYETTHTRIPAPVKPITEMLSREWKRALANGRDTESLLVECMECIHKWVYPQEKSLTGKPEKKQALEVDQLRAEIANLRESLAAKEAEIELFKTMSSKPERPDLSKLRRYQPNANSGQGFLKPQEVEAFIEQWLSNT